MSHITTVERTFTAQEQLVSTTDLNGTITYANPEFCEIAGYSLEELIGQFMGKIKAWRLMAWHGKKSL